MGSVPGYAVSLLYKRTGMVRVLLRLQLAKL